MSIKIVAHPSNVRRLSYCLTAHHSSCETASKQSYDMTWSITDSSPVVGAVKFVRSYMRSIKKKSFVVWYLNCLN